MTSRSNLTSGARDGNGSPNWRWLVGMLLFIVAACGAIGLDHVGAIGAKASANEVAIVRVETYLEALKEGQREIKAMLREYIKEGRG